MPKRTDLHKILIIGSGPIVTGQACEFDYSGTQACKALRQEGYRTVLVSSNPETIMTDPETADITYIEPLTVETLTAIIKRERPDALLPTVGGQIALDLALALADSSVLAAHDVELIGARSEAIRIAEDRERLGALLNQLGIPHPENGVAMDTTEAEAIATRLGYPVLVRPAPVLGGRASMIVCDEKSLDNSVGTAFGNGPERPVRIEKFLERAIEFDVDVLVDETSCVIAGIQEHIEETCIHSGNSPSVLPTVRTDPEHVETIRLYTRKLAQALSIRGLMNVKFALKDQRVYVLDVNPRASRTAPFVSKATGVSLARIAALLMAGASLKEFNLPDELTVPGYFVKFPFGKFPEVAGLETHSTGEVMGIGDTFGEAYGKAMTAAGLKLPNGGTAFISVNQTDKGQAVLLARRLVRLGFKLMATEGTAARLCEVGLEVEEVFKVSEGRPNIVDRIKQREVALIINTPQCLVLRHDEQEIRQAALQYNVPSVTTITGARAVVEAIGAQKVNQLTVHSLQELHALRALAVA
jgi:carbamoyl-phosphate synthase large subunit